MIIQRLAGLADLRPAAAMVMSGMSPVMDFTYA